MVVVSSKPEATKWFVGTLYPPRLTNPNKCLPLPISIFLPPPSPFPRVRHRCTQADSPQHTAPASCRRRAAVIRRRSLRDPGSQQLPDTMADSPFTTPKRKRGDVLGNGLAKLDTTAQFTFDVNSNLDDGDASPRTRVAHRFRGLALGGGVGASGLPTDPTTVDDIDEEDEVSRKRVKLPDVEMRDADSPTATDPADPVVPTLPRQPLSTTGNSPPRTPAKSVRIALDDTILKQSEALATPSSTPLAEQTSVCSFAPPTPPHPSDLPHPSPPNRTFKRSGTPPFPTPTTTAATSTPPATDPLPSSLTWHDSEITIYDPDDSDDDGTGINGIGFKPTPAIAYARTVRRRQQLAEYRKREEREARAKRSLRRRGASPAPGLLETGAVGKKTKRRVRFLEAQGVAGEVVV